MMYKRKMCMLSTSIYGKIIERKMGKVLVALLLGLMWKVAVEVKAAIELPEHLKGPAKILRNTCKAETNVSEDLIEKSKGGYLPDDKALQCYIECLFRTVGLYDDAGNIRFDDVAHIIPTEIKEKLDNVTAACKTVRKFDFLINFGTAKFEEKLIYSKA
ncbi:general odorant-binding protein 83a-like isoform X1 [Bradysia coprophila]|uniref:general odorant-binding protein 83a-like isoform X1 n=1 Tax=Bradysia coprophila TaxID=38358 RepID=UPI00187D9478|nr:general odorant-binding protein 83a-like isoform X1 [Bradysia coprophila]